MTTVTEAAERGGSSLLFRNSWGWMLGRGILALILGVLAILFPASALYAFTLVLAAFLFVDGAFSLASGIRGAVSRRHDGQPRRLAPGDGERCHTATAARPTCSRPVQL